MLKPMLTFIALLLFAASAGAAEFNSNWTPKPLVDNQAPVTKRAGLKPAAYTDAEAMLKPAEPFIASVEKRLYIQSSRNTTLIQRLNHLQGVLFGSPKYEDAGQLLSALTELFPQEAARAHAELSSQLQRSSPSAFRISSVSLSRVNKNHISSGYAAQLSPISEVAQNRKPFWRPALEKRDDDWVTLKNDSFSNDHPSDVFLPRQALPSPKGR